MDETVASLTAAERAEAEIIVRNAQISLAVETPGDALLAILRAYRNRPVATFDDFDLATVL